MKQLIYIQSTDGSVKQFKEKGFWPRQQYLLSEYAKEFEVYYYSFDNSAMQADMPLNVTHKVKTFHTRIYGLNHIFYYLFLLKEAFKWKGKRAVIRIWGTTLPVVGLTKMISGLNVVISFQYDWAKGVKQDYKGIKTMVSAWVQNNVLSNARHVICTMSWLRDVAITRYHKDEQDITIIPNFVNTDLFAPAASGKKEQIAFAGRLHWSKGVDTLIDAFRAFSQHNKNWRLVIMGSGEELENLKERAKGIPVDFAGSVNYQKVAEIVNESHIFVLPTKTMEGHPKALIEAMAAGCNCITSNVPGNIDVMRESGMEKYTFEPGNADDLLDKLITASSTPPGIQMDFAIDHYSSKKLIAKEIAILNRFLDN